MASTFDRPPREPFVVPPGQQNLELLERNATLHDKGIGELLGKLRDDSTQLVKGEIEIVKRETSQQLHLVQRRAAAVAISGAVAHIGVALLLFGLALLLALVMPLWAATLIVGVVACAGAGVLALQQKKALSRIDPAPSRAMRRLRTDYAAIKEAAR
jgi:hypothetical protein